MINFKQILSEAGKLPRLFKEAVQYVLPKALMEPIYHFFYYCNIMQVRLQYIYTCIHGFKYIYIYI